MSTKSKRLQIQAPLLVLRQCLPGLPAAAARTLETRNLAPSPLHHPHTHFRGCVLNPVVPRLRICTYAGHTCNTETAEVGRVTRDVGVAAGGWSLRAFRRKWERVLRENGVPEPDWSVKWILEHVMKDRSVVSLKRDRLSASQSAWAEELLSQRLKRVPVQYVLGEWEFRHATLSMRPPVFVPTPETEELVGHVIQDLTEHWTSTGRCRKDLDSKHDNRPSYEPGCPVKVLDMCCGSGAIAVSILQECPQVEVVAVDISKEAVELTKENALRNDVSHRLSVLNTSAQEAAEHFIENNISFDCLVSNPPYLTSAELAVLQPEISDYMDKRALFGGKQGLELTAEILSSCRHYLRPPLSRVWLELGHQHFAPLSSLLRASPNWKLSHLTHRYDHHQRSRFHQLQVIGD